MRVLFSVLFCCVAVILKAQNSFQDTSIFAAPILLDSVSVKAANGGWDIASFIRRVQTDTTFYKAFRGMRLVSYTATNDLKVLEKDNAIRASLYSHTRQTAIAWLPHDESDG